MNGGFYQLLPYVLESIGSKTLNRCKKVSVKFYDLFPVIELLARNFKATFLTRTDFVVRK